MRAKGIRRIIAVAVLGVGVVLLTPVTQAAPLARTADARTVADYWTAARKAAAIPRDIVVNDRGKSFMLDATGKLRPYGLDKAVAPAGKGKPGGGASIIASAAWTKGGTVQLAAGRLYFTMGGVGYVCSGSTVTDGSDSISVILTAAHCVYDDAAKAFAANVLFIPDLSSSGTKTFSACSTAYLHGCWVPSYGVVSHGWAGAKWPNNIPYDYAFYVVQNHGGHLVGSVPDDDPLDGLAALDIEWTAANVSAGTLTDALGYSYKQDPLFMYCEQGLGSVNSGIAGYVNRWLSSCKLSGGSSGGPWMAASVTGNGPVWSVNSWGYQGKPGMAGPNLQADAPKALYDATVGAPAPADGGLIIG